MGPSLPAGGRRPLDAWPQGSVCNTDRLNMGLVSVPSLCAVALKGKYHNDDGIKF